MVVGVDPPLNMCAVSCGESKSSLAHSLPAASLASISFDSTMETFFSLFPVPFYFLLDVGNIFSRSLEQVEVRVTTNTNLLLNFYPSQSLPMKASTANICRALNLCLLNAAVVAEGRAWHRHGNLLCLRGSWPVEENRKMSV